MEKTPRFCIYFNIGKHGRPGTNTIYCVLICNMLYFLHCQCKLSLSVTFTFYPPGPVSSTPELFSLSSSYNFTLITLFTLFTLLTALIKFLTLNITPIIQHFTSIHISFCLLHKFSQGTDTWLSCIMQLQNATCTRANKLGHSPTICGRCLKVWPSLG